LARGSNSPKLASIKESLQDEMLVRSTSSDVRQVFRGLPTIQMNFVARNCEAIAGDDFDNLVDQLGAEVANAKVVMSIDSLEQLAHSPKTGGRQ